MRRAKIRRLDDLLVIAGLTVVATALLAASPDHDECLEYNVATSERFYGHVTTETESTVRVVFGPERGRLDAGNTGYILREEMLALLFHDKKQRWELAPPVVLEPLVSGKDAAELSEARRFAVAKVSIIEASGVGAEREKHWAFGIVQGRLGLNQRLDIWTKPSTADHERSFWELLRAIAELSPFWGAWSHEVPSISGIPSRAIFETHFAWDRSSSHRIEMTASTCETRRSEDVYVVPEGYEKTAFDLSALFAIHGDE